MIRAADGAAQHVLVVGGIGGLAVSGRRARRRRAKALRRGAEAAAPEVPVTRLTVIRPGPLGDPQAAKVWLRELEGSEERREDLVAEGVTIVNRALHANRLATQDPHGGDVSAHGALTTRIGYGSPDDLAEGRWADAIDVRLAAARSRRVEALRPQERLAATLGRRRPLDACETLILRARADLDAERPREAALQLRVGLEALLAEVPAEPQIDTASAEAGIAGDQAAAQVADLEELSARRGITGEVANEALRGELRSTRAEEVEQTLRLCERVLRRRRILGE